jgi:DNA-binding CsgD family transcriptional regulator
MIFTPSRVLHGRICGMGHIPVFLSIGSLVAGTACLARMAAAYGLSRERGLLYRLAFFASYSILMLVGLAFSYYFTNIGNDTTVEYVFAGLIFLAMSAIELSFPRMMEFLRPVGKPVGPRVTGVSAAVTALQAGLIWILPRDIAYLALVLAFAPFFLVILGTLIRTAAIDRRAFGPPLGGTRISLLYIPIGLLAAAELAFLSAESGRSGYTLLSLPLAYGLTSWQFFRSTSPSQAERRGGIPLEIPQAVIERTGLSARETEMANLILEGKENKEIAAGLGLSENTVRNHIYSLFKKLNIQRRMDLVRIVRGES